MSDLDFQGQASKSSFGLGLFENPDLENVEINIKIECLACIQPEIEERHFRKKKHTSPTQRRNLFITPGHFGLKFVFNRTETNNKLFLCDTMWNLVTCKHVEGWATEIYGF